jgi:micrococcal nuclease
MKKRLAIFAPLAVLALASCGEKKDEPPQPIDTNEYVERAADVLSFASPDQAASALREICAALPASTSTFAVETIEDGDTIIISDGRHIRYLGVDSPEMNYQTGEPEPHAQEATDCNRRLLQGRRVQLEFGIEKTDHYGRTLAYVFAVGEGGEKKFVNAEMVLAGFALAKRFPPDVKYAEVFSALEEFAAARKAGLWRDTPSGCVASTKSAVFHRKNCKWALQISPANLVEFPTRKQALLSGRHPCRTCKP